MKSHCQLVLGCVLSAGTLLCCVVSWYSVMCVTDGRGG